MTRLAWPRGLINQAQLKQHVLPHTLQKGGSSQRSQSVPSIQSGSVPGNVPRPFLYFAYSRERSRERPKSFPRQVWERSRQLLGTKLGTLWDRLNNCPACSESSPALEPGSETSSCPAVPVVLYLPRPAVIMPAVPPPPPHGSPRRCSPPIRRGA